MALAVVAGCAQSQSKFGSAHVSVALTQTQDETQVKTVSVTISGVPGSPNGITQTLSKNMVGSPAAWDGTWIGDFNGLFASPAGSTGYTFTGTAYDGTTPTPVELFSGSVVSPIVGGQGALVVLTLQSVAANPTFQNGAPVISSLTSSGSSVDALGLLHFGATYYEPINGCLNDKTTWSASTGSGSVSTPVGGFVTPNALQTDWNAPGTEETVTIKFVVAQQTTCVLSWMSDGVTPNTTVTLPNPLSTSVQFTVNVATSLAGTVVVQVNFNHPPVVESMFINNTTPLLASQVTLSVAVADPDTGDVDKVLWTTGCPGHFVGVDTGTATSAPPALETTTVQFQFADSTVWGGGGCYFYTSVADYDSSGNPRGGTGSGDFYVNVYTSQSLVPQQLPVVDLAQQDTTDDSANNAPVNLYISAHSGSPAPTGPHIMQYTNWTTNSGVITPDPVAQNHVIWTPGGCVDPNATNGYPTANPVTATVTITDNDTGLSLPYTFSMTISPTCAPKGCNAILAASKATEGATPAADGAYVIDPDGAGPAFPIPVWCDMTRNGGGWALISTIPLITQISATTDFHTTSLPNDGAGAVGETSTMGINPNYVILPYYQYGYDMTNWYGNRELHYGFDEFSSWGDGFTLRAEALSSPRDGQFTILQPQGGDTMAAAANDWSQKTAGAYRLINYGTNTIANLNSIEQTASSGSAPQITALNGAAWISWPGYSLPSPLPTGYAAYFGYQQNITGGAPNCVDVSPTDTGSFGYSQVCAASPGLVTTVQPGASAADAAAGDGETYAPANSQRYFNLYVRDEPSPFPDIVIP